MTKYISLEWGIIGVDAETLDIKTIDDNRYPSYELFTVPEDGVIQEGDEKGLTDVKAGDVILSLYRQPNDWKRPKALFKLNDPRIIALAKSYFEHRDRLRDKERLSTQECTCQSNG